MSRRRGARDRTWRPPAAPQRPVREVIAEPSERPSWPRSAQPTLGQSAATAARLGQGLPPAAVEAQPAPDPDAYDGPRCANCGGRHPTPGGDRPAWARTVGQLQPADPRQQRPPGWGRDRGRCS